MEIGDAQGTDPGLAGEVPFVFQCQRSGRCCRVGAGFVWLEESEIEGMAREARLTPATFRTEHVRRVPDPRTGELRLALREPDYGSPDRCRFLEGSNECSVYEGRPKHCRDFPYWPSVLESADGLARARAMCPGIQPVKPAHDYETASAQLRALFEELQRELDALAPKCSISGLCCRFEEAGHELFAGRLETEYALAHHPSPGEPEKEGRCPYHQKGVCTAREGRPLACRTYFCDESKEEELFELHERYLVRLRAIEADCGFDREYARFPALVAQAMARGAADPPREE